jgi:hypothetical protein
MALLPVSRHPQQHVVLKGQGQMQDAILLGDSSSVEQEEPQSPDWQSVLTSQGSPKSVIGAGVAVLLTAQQIIPHNKVGPRPLPDNMRNLT